jgi:hypothetical protein
MRRILSVVFVGVFLLPLTVQGQTWNAEQQEVWKMIEDSWVADTQDDPTWYDRFVHPNFQGWSMTWPVPMGFELNRRWNRYNQEASETLLYSLHPVAIVVQGNTAVAFTSFPRPMRT